MLPAPLVRLLRAAWSPFGRASRAVGRALAGFFAAGWPGLTLGTLAAILGFCGLMGAFMRTGLWRPLDVLLAVLAGGLAVGLTALALLLLRLILRAWPARFVCWGLGAFLGGLVLFASMGAPMGMALGMLAGLAALLGGLGLGLGVALSRGLHRAYRLVGGLLVAATLLGSISLVHWLFSPGSDPNLETQVLAAGPAVAPLELPDPSKPGPFQVAFLTYGSGQDRRRPEYGAGVPAPFRTASVDASPFLKGFTGFKATVRTWYWGFGKEAFPLNGRVWQPQGPGPFPLVLCVHGNHTAQDFSDPGYQYLGEHLASRGFIFVSVDENFLNGSWEGGIDKENAVRGWILLKHLETWRAWNRQAGHPFQGKVDLDRIALIGHSRGGEAVALAAAMNRLSRWPEDATQVFDFGFGLRAVAAIAPIDGQYEPSGVGAPVRDVDYLVLQGSHDSDVSMFAGQRTLRRVAFTDGRPHFKASLYVHRANHGQFNTRWGALDSGEPLGRFLAPGALLPAEEQRRVARTAIGAFLEASLKDQRGYVAFFRDTRRGAAWLPRVITFNQYEDTSFKPLATFMEDIDPCSATAPGGRIEASGLSVWKEGMVKGRGGWNFRHKGVWLGWERMPDAKDTASYALTLPEGFAAGGPGASPRLVLSLADTDDDPHVEKEGAAKAQDAKPKDKAGEGKKAGPDGKDAKDGKKAGKPKEPVDFTVELVDAEGHAAALPLSAIRPLQPVVKVRFSKWDAMEGLFEGAWEPVFQTFELPLAAFAKANPAFRPERLRRVSLRFDRSPKGVVILDRVGFAEGD